MSAPARFATPRTASRDTFGTQVGKVAARLGTPLMPWQAEVADVAGELDPSTGLPCFREVVVTVPRQHGKSLLVLAFELQRAIGWGTPQQILYSAQTGQDARKKLLLDQWPLLAPHQRAFGIERITRSNGNEGVEWKNGSRLGLMGSGVDAGHGRTVDLAVLDELMADTDDRRQQALVPAMATRSAAQILIVSTAGTDESAPFNAAVARGRQAALAGCTTGIAYFEWSADEDADPDDPAVWRACMPALGHTITEHVVMHARNTLSDSEFRRAFLNIPSSTAPSAMVDAETWAAVQAPNAVPTDPLILAVDVNVDRDGAAIVAWSESARVVEVVEHRQGLDWVPDRLVELHARHKPTITCDGSPRAPIAGLLPEIQRRGVPTKPMKASEYPAACGRFFDAILAKDLKVRPHPALTAAIAGAQRRSSGDGFTFSRKGRADISPLVAAAIAVWTKPTTPKRTFVFR